MKSNPAAPQLELAGDRAQSRKRLLLISYHFPPSRVVGALRWQKLAGHAWDHGWGLDAVSLAATELKAADPGTLSDLPAGTRVVGVRDAGPMLWERVEKPLWAVAKRLRRARSPERASTTHNVKPASQSLSRSEVPKVPLSPHDWRRAYEAWTIYSRERAWALKAVAAALELCDPAIHQAIVTCGPPHMVHEAGRLVASRTGVPHVMDLRDPWADVERLTEGFASPVWYALARRHERRCIGSAAMVVMNTEPARARIVARYPERGDAVIAVTNGCDDVLPTAASNAEDRGPFRIAYAGSMYLDRDPRPLLRGAALVVREFGLDPSRFCLDFIGHVASYGGVPLMTLAQEEGIADHVRVHAPMPRPELFRLLAGAAVLVNLPQDSDLAIPSKIYEYAGFPAWLLAFAEPRSATAQLLLESGADVVRPEDSVGAAAVLRRRFLEYQSGVRPAPIATQARFTRRHQAGILFDALTRLRAPVAPAAGSASVQ